MSFNIQMLMRMEAKELGDLLGVLSLEKLLGYKREAGVDDKRTSFTCNECGKSFKRFTNLSRHETYYCKKGSKVPILKMKWNGKNWKIVDRSKLILYHIRLGYQLNKLIKNESIGEDVLNSTQKEYLSMYRKLCLFTED